MSKALRWSDKWFQRGLWLVALAFAWSLIGLGSIVVKQMQGVEPALTLQQFILASSFFLPFDFGSAMPSYFTSSILRSNMLRTSVANSAWRNGFLRMTPQGRS